MIDLVHRAGIAAFWGAVSVRGRFFLPGSFHPAASCDTMVPFLQKRGEILDPHGHCRRRPGDAGRLPAFYPGKRPIPLNTPSPPRRNLPPGSSASTAFSPGWSGRKTAASPATPMPTGPLSGPPTSGAPICPSTYPPTPRARAWDGGSTASSRTFSGCRATAWPTAIVTSANRGSCAFHEALGYRAAARFDRCGWKFGAWYGTVWYEKRLRSGPPVSAPIGWRQLPQPPIW